MRSNVVTILLMLTLAGAGFCCANRAQHYEPAEYRLPDADGRIVSLVEYEHALPVINAGNVNVYRPPLIDSGILFQLSANRKVRVQYQTRESALIGGEYWRWYKITVWDGPRKNYGGWVYGKYLSFQNGFEASFWKLKESSLYGFIRHVFAEKFLALQFGNYANERGYSTELMKNYRLINSEPVTEGYFDDNGFSKNMYQTDFGTLSAFVNEDQHTWVFDSLEILAHTAVQDACPGLLWICSKIDLAKITQS